MTYSILFLPSAKKSLVALPRQVQRRVDDHIMALSTNPRPNGAIPLRGSADGIWRLRVGDYRILYEIRDRELVVIVVDVGHRREIYRGL